MTDDELRAALGGDRKERQIARLTEKYGRRFYVGKSGLVQDSLWETAEYKAVEAAVDAAVERQLEEQGLPGVGFGICHEAWRIKKSLLKSQYGIDWLSPAELNPFVLFD